MPELPEVETTRLGLLEHLDDAVIEKVEVREPRLRYPVDASRLRQAVEGHRITSIERRGKYLLCHLDHGIVLMFHLGMSGSLRFVEPHEPVHKHDLVIFHLSDGRQLRFRDQRRFGLVDVVSNGELETDPRLRDLGIEPFSDEFNAETLHRLSRGRKKPVKNFLMDGHVVAGLGNVYATEALFHAGVRPTRSVGRISQKSWQRIVRAVRMVLRAAIAKGGTTLSDFVGSDGNAGYFQFELYVYGRAGEPCKKCGTPIRRVVLVGRSTFYCPKCQR